LAKSVATAETIARGEAARIRAELAAAAARKKAKKPEGQMALSLLATMCKFQQESDKLVPIGYKLFGHDVYTLEINGCPRFTQWDLPLTDHKEQRRWIYRRLEQLGATPMFF